MIIPYSNSLLNLVLTATFGIITWIILIFSQRRQRQITQLVQSQIDSLQQDQSNLVKSLQTGLLSLQDKITQSQYTIQPLIIDAIQRQMIDVREQIGHSFHQHALSLTQHLQSITEEIRNQLHNLSHQVNHRLSEGFEKTSATFIDVVKRLAIIDEAQKKITELSQHVVSLQDVLVDKRARGAFGEVQLANLIGNALPSQHYSLQHTLSNQKRADCILFLPDPTGNLVIDAKFPLEGYQRLMNSDPSSVERKSLQQQFRQDLQKHIKDIAEKYILPPETTD